jgi:chromate transporter
MIRRSFVDKHGWLSEEEFSRDWSICQLAPGINLVALAYLIGKRLGGWKAILVSLAGMLLPSFAIAVGLTIAFVGVSSSPAIRSALRMVVPAIVGIGLATAIQLGRPILKEARTENTVTLAWLACLLVGSAVVVFVWHPPVILVLLSGGVIGAVASMLQNRIKGAS